MRTMYSVLESLQKEVHAIAASKGWWVIREAEGLNERRYTQNAALVALIHSEASELLEGLRHGNGPSDHIPNHCAAEEELADIIIRCLDMAEGNGWNLPSALLAKIEFNRNRPMKHGGKRF